MMVALQIYWEPRFFADMDPNAEDSDYLRDMGCCAGCGAYMEDLPGYWYIEDSDSCPQCRSEIKEESWINEVKRLMIRCGESKEDIEQTVLQLTEILFNGRP